MKFISKEKLLKEYGKLYSEELGINLDKKNEKEIFKWFLASVLFGAPISESNAEKTFRILDNYNINTPDKILKSGWNRLVELLDNGGYTRYDFKTADKLLELSKNIKKEKGLIQIYKISKDEQELREMLQNLAKGIGDITINIFLRDMQGIWNVKPKHTKAVIEAANKLHIKLGTKFDKKLDTALIRYIHKHKNK
ncbi:MAG: hypothetical protein M1538_03760 [Candidatus Marsarchaeota archaeon]|jgi:thermostable 8-oxoguanine DNA glycosylase|nr:hypothetical protein [Deltaproteobacteria bacterium]MCL5434057.1 hypothetical protein [Candidatus Marsarchaeota archaeon]